MVQVLSDFPEESTQLTFLFHPLPGVPTRTLRGSGWLIVSPNYFFTLFPYILFPAQKCKWTPKLIPHPLHPQPPPYWSCRPFPGVSSLTSLKGIPTSGLSLLLVLLSPLPAPLLPPPPGQNHAEPTPPMTADGSAFAVLYCFLPDDNHLLPKYHNPIDKQHTLKMHL